MLKRVYIDNYRCFVNFELELGSYQLVMGLNGTGKSTLLGVLESLRSLLIEGAPLSEVFPQNTRTRWQTLPTQTFELGVELDGDRYDLLLQMDIWGSPGRTRIIREDVSCNGHPVFSFVSGEVNLFNERFERKVQYPFDWFRSALSTQESRPENKKLMRFKGWLASVYCLRIDPKGMVGRTEKETSRPSSDMDDFASWYRHLTQENGGAAGELQSLLRSVLPGFESLDSRLVGGEVRMLSARFEPVPSVPKSGFSVGFEELSDGQRALICMYALLIFLVEGSTCLFIDEPENFVALPELQPWLQRLGDRIEDRGGQVTLFSHHPEMIDYLAAERGIFFERVGSGPIRAHRYRHDDEQSLRLSELIARGWVGPTMEVRD